MKWLCYVIVIVYMLYRTVYGLKVAEPSLSVEPVTYGDDDFLKIGGHKTISCKASNRNQKVEWIDPSGRVVKRIPGSRVFSQEHFVQSMRGRAPALVLTITSAQVHDTGVYQCKSGDLVKNVSLCVVDPSDFGDTTTEVVSDLGRSITLSCQAKGEPEPRLLWNRNGEVITDEDSSSKYRVMTKYNIQGFEGLLTVTSLEPEDSGVYSCVSIQESTQAEDCTHTTIFNITLNVNYAPIFEDGNDTKLVYGRTNQEVEITCAAVGYPVPTYKWYKDLGGDILEEFDKKLIKLSEDNSQAVVTVVANQSTFGQRFKCQASNEHGTSEKYFTLLKMEKPRRPSEVTLFNATGTSVNLNLTWYDGILFPITAYDIQYLKEQTEGNRRILPPREVTWRKSKLTEIPIDESSTVETESESLLIGLNDLEQESAYWVRLRVKNEAGDSAWSDPTLVSTIAEDDIITTEAPEAEPETSSEDKSASGSSFYGIFFLGALAVTGLLYMFAMKMI